MHVGRLPYLTFCVLTKKVSKSGILQFTLFSISDIYYKTFFVLCFCLHSIFHQFLGVLWKSSLPMAFFENQNFWRLTVSGNSASTLAEPNACATCIFKTMSVIGKKLVKKFFIIWPPATSKSDFLTSSFCFWWNWVCVERPKEEEG